MDASAAEPKPAQMTIVQECPVTGSQHSFTIDKKHLLSSESLEDVAGAILDSDPLELAIERSRALMEVVYKLIRWERGMGDHPLLPEVGWYEDARDKNLVPSVEED